MVERKALRSDACHRYVNDDVLRVKGKTDAVGTKNLESFASLLDLPDMPLSILDATQKVRNDDAMAWRP